MRKLKVTYSPALGVVDTLDIECDEIHRIGGVSDGYHFVVKNPPDVIPWYTTVATVHNVAHIQYLRDE